MSSEFIIAKTQQNDNNSMDCMVKTPCVGSSSFQNFYATTLPDSTIPTTSSSWPENDEPSSFSQQKTENLTMSSQIEEAQEALYSTSTPNELPYSLTDDNWSSSANPTTLSQWVDSYTNLHSAAHSLGPSYLKKQHVSTFPTIETIFDSNPNKVSSTTLQTTLASSEEASAINSNETFYDDSYCANEISISPDRELLSPSTPQNCDLLSHQTNYATQRGLVFPNAPPSYNLSHQELSYQPACALKHNQVHPFMPRRSFEKEWPRSSRDLNQNGKCCQAM